MRHLPSLTIAAVAACLAVFGVPWTAAATLGFAALLWPWGLAGRLRAGGGLAGLALSAALAWVPLLEYQDRVDALRATLDRGGPAALSTRDLAGIWFLNVGMAGGGALVGFPEVAAETLLLAIPDPDGVRVFHSDFALASPRVRAAVADLGPGESRRVTFTYADHADARVGLALNPLTLTREGDEIVGRVPVDYPARARLPLLTLGGRRIVVDEGLYDALEARGWLFPYTAEWRWPR